MRGPATAPPTIRVALRSAAGNSTTELGVDLSAAEGLADAGDLELSDAAAEARSQVEAGIEAVLDVISLIHAVPGVIVGADVVEFNLSQDLGGVTAGVAAKIVKEIAGMMWVQAR